MSREESWGRIGKNQLNQKLSVAWSWQLDIMSKAIISFSKIFSLSFVHTSLNGRSLDNEKDTSDIVLIHGAGVAIIHRRIKKLIQWIDI